MAGFSLLKSKFIKLAEKRVSRTLNDLKLIRNLSNKNYYEYSDEQSKKIIRALQQELDLLKNNWLHKLYCYFLGIVTKPWRLPPS